MNYMVIPDIHGRTDWQEPAHTHVREGGEVIFLGDYNDSWNISDQQMLDNFTDLILFKEQHPDHVTLLLGNHCFPYISAFYSCSGNRKSIWGALNILYAANMHLFQMAKQVGNTLFVHAGLTKDWLHYNKEVIERQIGESIEKYVERWNYAGLLNHLYMSHERPILYQVSKVHGGYDFYDGPVWVRPSQLLNSLPENIHQVVGHTHMPRTIREDVGTSSVTFTDCMGNADWQPLILDL